MSAERFWRKRQVNIEKTTSSRINLLYGRKKTHGQGTKERKNFFSRALFSFFVSSAETENLCLCTKSWLRFQSLQCSCEITDGSAIQGRIRNNLPFGKFFSVRKYTGNPVIFSSHPHKPDGRLFPPRLDLRSRNNEFLPWERMRARERRKKRQAVKMGRTM